MPDKAIISHRGEKYEIGRGNRFYGIWVTGAPYSAPVDRWPETRDGWAQAWARFAAMEAPGTIVAVSARRPALWPRPGRASRAEGGPGQEAAGRRGGTALLAGEGLLVLGVVFGLAGLFPAYAGGRSLLSQGYQTVPHLAYVLVWAVSAGLIALGVARPGTARLGALLGLGVSLVTFGLFLTDVGAVTSQGASLGTGLVVSLAGWAACTAGSALAFAATRHDQEPLAPRPGRPRSARPVHVGSLTLLLLAGIGTAIAFAPSWDSYTLATSTAGSVQTITAGNAFANPGMVIAGNVAVMVAVVVAAVAAALWRRPRQGALLLAGAVVVLAAQAVSALIQVSQPAAPSMFGISPAQAAAVGLTITSGVTPIFWVYCVFVFSLLVSCGWLFTVPGQPSAMSPVSAPWPPVTHGPADAEAARAATGTAGNENPGRDAAETGEAGNGPSGGEAPDSDVTKNSPQPQNDSDDGSARSAYA